MSLRRAHVAAAVLVAASAPSCGPGEQAPRALTMAEVLADCPEELRLPTFLGLAFLAMRERQLDARPLEDFDLEDPDFDPVPLVTEVEWYEILTLLAAAEREVGWDAYPTGFMGQRWGLDSYPRYGLRNLTRLVVHRQLADWTRCEALMEAWRSMMQHGDMLDWLTAGFMLDAFSYSPLGARFWREPCITNADLLAMLQRNPAEPVREALPSRVAVVEDCVECMLRAYDAAWRESGGNPSQLFDDLLWSLQDVSCFEVCDSCDVAPEPVEAADGEVVGHLEMRRVWEQPGWKPDGSEACLLPEGELVALDPERTFLPLRAVRVVEGRMGRPALMFEAADPAAFREYSEGLVGKRVVFLAHGRAVASPYIEDPLLGGGVLLGGHDGFTPWEVTQVMRAIARSNHVPEDALLLGSGEAR